MKYQILKLAILLSLFFSMAIEAQSKDESYKLTNTRMTMNDVRLEILSFNADSGIVQVKLVGDCLLCNQVFIVSEETEIRTPFYSGEMDFEALEEHKFAQGEVSVNTASRDVIFISYMGEGY